MDLYGRIPTSIIYYISEFIDFQSYLNWSMCSKKLYQGHESADAHLVKFYSQQASIMRSIFFRKENVFITGGAGTGKSELLHYVHKLAKAHKRPIAMTATTGHATLAIPDCSTIHHFSRLGTGKTSVETLGKTLRKSKDAGKQVYKQWAEPNLIVVIDEISMLGSRYYEKMDLCARYARNNLDVAFGGVQLVVCGDFYQLPPIQDKFVFTSQSWMESKFKPFELSFSFRQTEDRVLSRLLQHMRQGSMTDAHHKVLESRVDVTAAMDLDKLSVKPIMISSKNSTVHIFNSREFERAEGAIVKVSHAQDIFRVTMGTGTMSEAQVRKALGHRLTNRQPDVLTLKVGVVYILTINYSVKFGAVNGMRGVLINPEYLQLQNGLLIDVDRFHQQLYSELVVANTKYTILRNQYTLRLGYAITIHASQGMTLDSAIINAGSDIFSSGQSYVAISRMKTLEKMYLTHYDRRRVRVNDKVRQFYSTLK